jgi:hypothetical protein
MSIRKYGGRYWALYDDAGELVCICLYKKGAAEVLRRLQQLPPFSAHPRSKPAIHPTHGSGANAWGSTDATSGLPFLHNASKINPRTADTMCLLSEVKYRMFDKQPMHALELGNSGIGSTDYFNPRCQGLAESADSTCRGRPAGQRGTLKRAY